MPDYNNLYQIAMALKAGAGNGPGQTHVDDYIRQNQVDMAPLSMLRPGGNTIYGNNQVSTAEGVNAEEEQRRVDELNKRSQAALDAAKKYDPNAKFDEYNQLQFDRSKLPKFMGAGINTPLTGLSTNNAGDRVKNSQYVIKDPNYGDYTPTGNLKEASNDSAGGGIMGQMQKYMPAVTLALMAAGVGAAAGPAVAGMYSQAMKYAQSGQMDKAGILMQIAKTIASQGAG